MKYYIAAADLYLDIVLNKLEAEIDKLKKEYIVSLRGDVSIAINDGKIYIVQGVNLENK